MVGLKTKGVKQNVLNTCIYIYIIYIYMYTIYIYIYICSNNSQTRRGPFRPPRGQQVYFTRRTLRALSSLSSHTDLINSGAGVAS